MTAAPEILFSQLELAPAVLKVLSDVGYESPTPIQAQTIPLMLEGKDVLGQAQTGTGKTAAFALPVLSNLDLKQKDPQVLVLAPTRELAIQVAEAFQTYAAKIKGFHVLPVYGGQDYRGQIRALERGVHVVVGTPGRVMDHMRRKTLKLNKLKTLVLDEADEMLRMGFIDDVEWILEQTPSERQIALFSATMPPQIRRIATKHLNEPEQITIKVTTSTAETIRQRYWSVMGAHKLDALTRVLEAEPFDGMIVFVRTKTATVELAEKLEARGYAASPLNGDIAQNLRERTINQLKKGKLDILVATDVAARGLDVDRISHVVNYDIPHDTESYIHRIGRTGRAGRQGDAILFVAPREKRLLYAIEKATKKKIEVMEAPSTDMINDRRISRFKQRITDTLQSEDLNLFSKLVEQYQQEHDATPLQVAAALAQLLQGDEPFLLQNTPKAEKSRKRERSDDRSRDGGKERSGDRQGDRRRGDRERDRPSRDGAKSRRGDDRSARKNSAPEQGMNRYRVEVGHQHEVRPGNIVGAIANEAGIDSQYIGRIDIQEDHSFVDLPEDMPRDIFKKLKKVWVSGQKLAISSADSRIKYGASERRAKPKSEFSDSPKKRSDSKSGGANSTIPKSTKPKSSKSKAKNTKPKKPKKPKTRSKTKSE